MGCFTKTPYTCLKLSTIKIVHFEPLCNFFGRTGRTLKTVEFHIFELSLV